MRILLLLTALLLISACSTVTCDQGTIEKNGKCEPADVTTGAGMCGSGTVLEGNECVSTIVCDPGTTMPVTDPVTGMTKCVGTAGGGCSACPAPSSNSKQTVCGQIYDLETNAPFAATGATGTRCSGSAATSGPCALLMQAFDAQQFSTNPTGATPLAIGDECIDDQGRFYLADIDISTAPSPLVGIGIDDANMVNMGPNGVTNAVGIAVNKIGGMTFKNVEDWIVKKSTTDSWASTGGPSIASGIHVPIFRAHAAGSGDQFANQAGVVFTKNGSSIPNDTKYFMAGQTNRTTIDAAATSTSVNGSATVVNVSLADGVLAFSGMGGITDTVNCKWPANPAAALPGIVTIQIYRKVAQLGKTCTE